MPEVSVIMGVYNTPIKYIKKAIDSILNQTFQNFEFIICNDCCTDDTFEYVKKTYSNNPKIIIIENEVNKGLAYTLNHCIRISKGEYIARMDADDFSHENRFEKQIEFLKRNPKIDLVSCCCNVFDENGIYGERIYRNNVNVRDFLFNQPIIHPAIMVRKTALDIVNNYRDIKKTYRYEDYDLFLRMLIAGQKMYILPDKLFDFREDQNSLKRRAYKYRINEYRVRYENFKKLGLLPKYYLYCVKPLIVGLIPNKVLNNFRNKCKEISKDD